MRATARIKLPDNNKTAALIDGKRAALNRSAGAVVKRRPKFAFSDDDVPPVLSSVSV